ncbi:hypothetical protein [Bradyrhizobium sp. S3.2.6]|uniref:hypothetical protein n=1 Tax=unclassified Bradyrhizobium TaxID=2631580 RepID=UPI003391CA73
MMLEMTADVNRKLPLQTNPDEAILRLARVLARLAAREDHERELANRNEGEKGNDLCSVFDGSSERAFD